MFRWYVINTYSGHENKVKANLEHRIVSMNQAPRFRRVVVPTEQVIETKDGQKVQIEKRVLPGYVLVNMDLNDEAWTVVKNTPGVTGFVGAGAKPVPLAQGEVDRILHTGAAAGGAALRSQVEFTLGESVKVTSGPLSDFDGEIVDVNADQQKLKVLVDIFERQVPVELGFDQVKKTETEEEMAKKVLTLIKLQIPGGQANPAPPVGPRSASTGSTSWSSARRSTRRRRRRTAASRRSRSRSSRTAPSPSSRRRRRRRADQGGARAREGLGRAEPEQGRPDLQGAAALDRRDQAGGSERARRRPGDARDRRHRPQHGRRGGAVREG